MSAISDIYDAIAGWSFTGVTTRNIDEVKNTVHSGDCPLRILLPFTEGTQGFIALGNPTKVSWVIRDLCLWKPAAEGHGIEQCADDLIGYLSDYADSLKSNRSPSGQSHISNISYRMGVFPWGNTDFWGVEIQITVEEYI